MSSSNTSPSKTSGQMHSMKGAIKETVGGAIKSANMKQSGREEHQLGNAEVRDAKETKGQGNNFGTTGNEGFRGHGSGAGPFSGNDLGQYENRNTGVSNIPGTHASAGTGSGPYDTTHTGGLGGHHGVGHGSAGEGMVEGLAATGGGAGYMGLNQGSTGAAQDARQSFGNQDRGFADRQAKQDFKEWERNAF
ncbi:hypothetical protein JR316_0004176 [Psilocybe cubensis]|uniref:Uncharacterized protein n=2 Tax=Psilocybe cubensis TaxID=181762 RepID=A0ACB8H3J8_PSICU|nr:hypothetical protein JR316_0004176 [Psilocybe cubensis]KAH9482081.1 hypothetical protein JR316_0004176 [Psilocybe cubensis]